MSGEITPPLPADLAIAAESLNWPVVEVGGRRLESDSAWREFLASASPAELLALWERDWGGADAEENEEDAGDAVP